MKINFLSRTQRQLMLSLNTWNFDESLVFSGIGAERNNILIDCFLQVEKDETTFYQYNSLEPNVSRKGRFYY